jgi:Cft2 family RNA processing exonuclease
MPYGATRELRGAGLTTFPAGHVLGAAMLLAEIDGLRILYTGDFRLGPAHTCAAAQLPQADVLVMESTFGDPAYRLPPREETAAALVRLVQSILAAGDTPVVHAYALGKAQEVTRILTLAGIAVAQHPTIFAISEVYRACGVELGEVTEYDGRPARGQAIVVPPAHHAGYRVRGLRSVRTIAVTGWAHDPHGRYRSRVDHSLPLSDHADFDDLLECVRQVQPRVIFCTHGPASFVEELRRRNHEAFLLDEQCHAHARRALAPVART